MMQGKAFLFSDCHIVSREWQCLRWCTRTLVSVIFFLRRIKEDSFQRDNFGADPIPLIYQKGVSVILRLEMSSISTKYLTKRKDKYIIALLQLFFLLILFLLISKSNTQQVSVSKHVYVQIFRKSFKYVT